MNIRLVFLVLIVFGPFSSSFASGLCDSYPYSYYNSGAQSKSGQYFAVGAERDSNCIDHMIVDVSSNGKDWTRAFTSPLPRGEAYDIATTPMGDVYVTGYTNNWITYHYDSQKYTWTLVDEVVGGLGRNIAIGPQGEIFVVGLSVDPNNSSWHWMVRRSLDNGETWKAVDDYSSASTQNAEAYRAKFDSKGNIYVIGQEGVRYGSPEQAIWVVRKSTDLGETWMTVDSVPFDPSSEDQVSDPTAIAIDSNDNVYVLGMRSFRDTASSDDLYVWFIRKSRNGGATWETLAAQTASLLLNELLITPTGELIVGFSRTMSISGPGGVWDGGDVLGVKSFDNGESWSNFTRGDLKFSPRFFSLTNDGNLFLGGHNVSWLSDQWRWGTAAAVVPLP
jgi:hypothetical protein